MLYSIFATCSCLILVYSALPSFLHSALFYILTLILAYSSHHFLCLTFFHHFFYPVLALTLPCLISILLYSPLSFILPDSPSITYSALFYFHHLSFLLPLPSLILPYSTSIIYHSALFSFHHLFFLFPLLLIILPHSSSTIYSTLFFYLLSLQPIL